jgi:kynureninase
MLFLEFRDTGETMPPSQHRKSMKFENTKAFAKAQDAADPLKEFRKRYSFPKHGKQNVLYFTGNSLGLQPKTVKEYINRELEDWAEFGVEGHGKARNPWYSYHEILTPKIARIVGAKKDEVVVTHSLTTNLHLLMVSFYRPTKKRFRILCEYKAFPSDQYALESQARFHGFDPGEAVVEVMPRPGEHTIREADILEAIETIGDELALVMFGGVNYYTGQLFNMEAITEAAHAVGAVAGFDLAHAAGNVELKLHNWNVDFAAWCSYKYMNSSPGGVSGLFIHNRHAQADLPRFAGWWGHDKKQRFKMEPGFRPMAGAEGWQLSNAPVLAMAAHNAALDEFEAAGMKALTAKSKLLTGYLEFVVNSVAQRSGYDGLYSITPTTPRERGCQLSLVIQHKGKAIFDYLSEHGVVADWREPEVIRLAPVPMYNSFEDVWMFGQILEDALKKMGLWKK